MRRALVALLMVGVALHASAVPSYFGFASGAFIQGPELAVVPDVVGLDLAAADTALEGAGLDTGTVTAVCSPATLDEVVSQNPAAGASAALASLVDLSASSGVECTWDFSGIPTGWYSIPNVLAEQDFVREMRVEASGAGVWAYWLPGAIRGTANLELNIAVISAEASGSAVWARWAPGSQPGNTGNLQLDMVGALNANFQ